METTGFKMTFLDTKNISNHNKAVNYIIIISKAQCESIIDIVEHGQRNYKKCVGRQAQNILVVYALLHYTL